MSPYIAIVKSRFNSFITDQLEAGAVKEFARHGFHREQIEIIEVPGAFEIPATVAALLRHRQFKAIVCVGAVIRGETSHFEYVCDACSRGIADLSQKSPIPITNGVLTVENQEQALARCGIKGSNHGEQAAAAAVEMIKVFKKIRQPVTKKVEKEQREHGASINSNT